MSDNASLIYVNLIEVKPLSRTEWESSPDGCKCRGSDQRYAEYLALFQPWRLMVRSGDNQKDLFRSTERYFNESDARRAAEIAFGANANVYLRQAEHGDVQLRLATE